LAELTDDVLDNAELMAYSEEMMRCCGIADVRVVQVIQSPFLID
jgi:hypothetical protein